MERRLIKFLNAEKDYSMIKKKDHELYGLLKDQYENLGKNINYEIDLFSKNKFSSYLKFMSKRKFILFEKIKSIFGFGEKKAFDLANKLNSFSEIKNVELTKAQKLGLKYSNYLTKQNTRKIIEIHFQKIEKQIKNKNKNKIEKILPVGSFRRKLEIMKDLDIIIVSNENLKTLIDETIFSEFFSFGPKKLSGISKIIIEGELSIIQVDIIVATKKEFPFALLYFTGPAKLNIQMRKIAKYKGFLLNEYELKRAKNQISNEKDIFDALNLKYLHPKQRGEKKLEFKTHL